ncbi:MAG: PIG-L deacetylase family protein [Acidimicrobiales bacterium]
MPELIDAAPPVALAIYAHPDDAEVSCGGTLATWISSGSRVEVLICNAGDKGAATPGVDPAELTARRAGEVKASAGVLGLAGYEILGIPDGELDNTVALRRLMVAAIRRVRPTVVVCPDPLAVFFGQDYYNHRDHQVAGWAALDATSPAAALPLYFPEDGDPHQVETIYLSGTLEPDVWVDITGTLETKVQALLCHASQLDDPGEWLRRVVRRRAEDGGKSAGVAFAEGFRRLRLAG